MSSLTLSKIISIGAMMLAILILFLGGWLTGGLVFAIKCLFLLGVIFAVDAVRLKRAPKSWSTSGLSILLVFLVACLVF